MTTRQIVSDLCHSALVMLVASAAFAQPAQPPAAAPPPIPRSPEIHPDRTVTFRLSAPHSSDVTLNGSWDGGANIKMAKDEGGVWSVTVGPLGAQLWGYWYMVDGVKALDPGNVETQRDGARYANLLMISGTESALWDFKDVPHGTVQAIWYPSPTLKLANRRMMVYTAAGLRHRHAQSILCCILLHGGGGDEDAWLTMGPGQHHPGQPHRARQGEADDRRDAERQRHADRVAGLWLRTDARAPVRASPCAAAHAGRRATRRRAGGGRARAAAALRGLVSAEPREGCHPVRRENISRAER
jgi:hypothetical protein